MSREGAKMAALTGKILVLTTCDSEEEAARIAGRLIDARLAACVAVTPRVRTMYRWKGEVEEAEEWALTIKTREALYVQVEEMIRKMHSYETPEILAVAVAGGSQAYLDWVDAETSPVAGKTDDVIR